MDVGPAHAGPQQLIAPYADREKPRLHHIRVSTELDWSSRTGLVRSTHGTGSLGHRVSGSFGSSFTYGSSGHQVIVLTRCETRVFPVFEKMPKVQNVHLKC